jgi:hypothetical protein
MSQYINRNLPVVTGIYSADVNEGTAVRYDAGGNYIAAVTASTDNWLGIAATSNNSASLGNVLVRSSGMVVKVKTASTIKAGSPLAVDASATFTIVTGPYYATVTGSALTGAFVPGAADVTVMKKIDAISLAAGVANDLVDAVLL